MNTILPSFRKPAADALASPMLRPFSVSLSFDGERHDLHILAFKACDAISNALDLFFDGEYEMPDSLSIKAHPANVLRAA